MQSAIDIRDEAVTLSLQLKAQLQHAHYEKAQLEEKVREAAKSERNTSEKEHEKEAAKTKEVEDLQLQCRKVEAALAEALIDKALALSRAEALEVSSKQMCEQEACALTRVALLEEEVARLQKAHEDEESAAVRIAVLEREVVRAQKAQAESESAAARIAVLEEELDDQRKMQTQVLKRNSDLEAALQEQREASTDAEIASERKLQASLVRVFELEKELLTRDMRPAPEVSSTSPTPRDRRSDDLQLKLDSALKTIKELQAAASSDDALKDLKAELSREQKVSDVAVEEVFQLEEALLERNRRIETAERESRAKEQIIAQLEMQVKEKDALVLELSGLMDPLQFSQSAATSAKREDESPSAPKTSPSPNTSPRQRISDDYDHAKNVMRHRVSRASQRIVSVRQPQTSHGGSLASPILELDRMPAQSPQPPRSPSAGYSNSQDLRSPRPLVVPHTSVPVPQEIRSPRVPVSSHTEIPTAGELRAPTPIRSPGVMSAPQGPPALRQRSQHSHGVPRTLSQHGIGTALDTMSPFPPSQQVAKTPASVIRDGSPLSRIPRSASYLLSHTSDVARQRISPAMTTPLRGHRMAATTPTSMSATPSGMMSARSNRVGLHS
jgi:hypothetical protein